jgi:glycosyltransferase involved in cell wall biosynthesis
MKRVLIVDQSPNLGGTVFGMYELARTLDRSRYEPVIAFCEPHPTEGRFRVLGVEVVHLIESAPPRKAAMSPRNDRAPTLLRGLVSLSRYELACARGVARIIRTHRIDLVHHNNHLPRDRSGVIATALRRVPQICHIHNLRRLAPEARFAARFVDRFVYMSKAIERVYLDCGIAPERGTVIYDAIDVPVPVDSHSLEALRAELGLDFSDFVIVNAGRIDTWKGHDIFVRAVASLVPYISSIKAVIAGEVSETARVAGFDAALNRLVEELGIASRIVFAGFRNDVPRLMAASDVVVHSATEPEPFGRVIVEGMMAGRPVIATNAGGVPEIIDDGMSGLLVPCRDVAALAGAIEYLHDHSSEANTLATEGRARAIQRFGGGRFATEMMRVYDEVLRRPRIRFIRG